MKMTGPVLFLMSLCLLLMFYTLVFLLLFCTLFRFCYGPFRCLEFDFWTTAHFIKACFLFLNLTAVASVFGSSPYCQP